MDYKSLFVSFRVLTYLIGSVSSQDYCLSGSCSCPFSDLIHDHHEVVERDVVNVEQFWQNSVEKLILDAGYNVETHEIRTADGYFLTYHRIPHGKIKNPYAVYSSKNRLKSSGEPVLVQHGVISSSACWAMSSDALGFVLADAGYDVWLANARGNPYSRKHVKLDPDKDNKYWDFSWHEMGFYDLPAAIDYILRETGRRKLFYIGHSMGTTMYFVLGATRPKYMSKIKAAVLLAPIMYPRHVRSPLITFIPILSILINCLSNGEELLALRSVEWVNENICKKSNLQFACLGAIFALTGFDKGQTTKEIADKIFTYTPAGLARKVLQHYLQTNRLCNGFRQYDYGHSFYGNMWMYGRFHSPTYQVDRITAPMFIYYAENDWLISPKDVMSTVEKLPKTVKKVAQVPYEKFNHVDFMWAKDGKTLLYDDIVKDLKSFHNFRKSLKVSKNVTMEL